MIRISCSKRLQLLATFSAVSSLSPVNTQTLISFRKKNYNLIILKNINLPLENHELFLELDLIICLQ